MAEQDTGAVQSTEDAISAGIDAAEEGMTNVPYGSEPTDAQIADLEGRSVDPSTQGQPGQQQADPQQQPGNQQPGQADPKAQPGQSQDGQQPAGDRTPKPDGQGNLVDPITGAVVARAGYERRIVERAEKTKQENDQLREQLNKHAQTIQELNNAAQLPTQLGLSTQESETGLRVMEMFKRDPVGAARYVIQEAMATGANLETIIGKGADGSTLDMGAVRGMIDQRLAPVTALQQTQQAQQEQQAREAEIERVAQENYDKFLAEHENAAMHEAAIASLMQRNNWAPDKAYYELKLYVQQQGMDFNQPLAPQLQARAQQGSQQQPTGQNGIPAPPVQPQSQPVPAIPTGSPAPVGTVPNTTHQRDVSLHADVDYDDIVLQSMKEAGLSVNL